MRFRFKMKELKEMSDDEMLRALVVERQSDCTNVYSPLCKRLASLYSTLDQQISKSKAIKHTVK